MKYRKVVEIWIYGVIETLINKQVEQQKKQKSSASVKITEGKKEGDSSLWEMNESAWAYIHI